MMQRLSLCGWLALACASGNACGSQPGTQGAAGSGPATGQTATAAPNGGAAPAISTSAGASATSSGGAGQAAVSGDDAVAMDSDAGPVARGGDSAVAVASPSTGSFPPVTDFMSNGPYEAVTLDSAGPNNNYTVFYPKDLAPNGANNPIVGWMSGGGTDPSLYPLLPLLATHGFVVVASNTIPGIGEEASLGQEIIAGIDWAIAENERDGSTFFHKLDTTKLASAGYSMGSLATFQIAGDARLITTVHISGGNMAPEPIHNLHAPAAFFCGIPGDDNCTILDTTCDIAAANCDMDFAAATTPVFYANFSGGHLGILTPPLQAQIQTEVVAWLRWQLMGDQTIKPRFIGDQCGVCQDSRWKVQQKNWN